MAQSAALQKFTFNIGGGATVPLGELAQRLDNGWHLSVGGGYNFAPQFGVIAEYMYHGMGVTRSTLNAASVPDGNAHIQSVTLNPIVRVNPKGRVDVYFIGGLDTIAAPSSSPSPRRRPFYCLIRSSDSLFPC